jgi:hypothetical protein
MRIGIDLDNTIISYDAQFRSAALGRGLIAPQVPAQKNAIKHAIQKHQGNDAWTQLQAEVYGPMLAQARPFDGVKDFFRHCRAANYPVCILSHKSRHPALGSAYDLRAAAIAWLEQQGWFSPDGLGLCRNDVEFHDTRAAKVQAIFQRNCDVFIDDLPEVFAEPGFPARTTKILFDPEQLHPVRPHWKLARSWAEIEAELFSPVAA